jgi:hypothetical protein
MPPLIYMGACDAGLEAVGQQQLPEQPGKSSLLRLCAFQHLYARTVAASPAPHLLLLLPIVQACHQAGTTRRTDASPA